MSTNSECEFFETEPGKWFYALETKYGEEDREVWDWREEANAYGPFESYDQADEHLRENHANPGGHSITTHTEFRMDDVWSKLIAEAPSNMRMFGYDRWPSVR
jgi:hypothetical protein